jgi:hypothetical protein
MSAEGVKDEETKSDVDLHAVQQPYVPENKTANKDTILFQEKIEIHTDKPLPMYDVERNRAYRGYAKDKGKTPLIVLVCERHSVVRMSAIPVYSGIINPGMIQLVEHGRIYWPPARQERYVLIYLDVLGRPLLTEGQGKREALGWKQEDALNVFVKPMVNILMDLRDKDFVHGAIRAHNIFDCGVSDKPRKVILGECLSVPASYGQPLLYETITRGMADPVARGKGTLEDDLYAFGVTLAVIMRQHDPMQGLSAEEILHQKITQGSYSSITGKDRFKGEILELLRGLLHDDVTQRWGLNEILGWLDGRRLSPKQAVITKKAQRAFPFGTEKYFLLQLLAMDLEKLPGELKKVTDDDSLQQWLERSLEDDEASQRLVKAVNNARQAGMGAGYEDRLVGNVSIALDPTAPMRFKGLHLTGEGLGAALAEAVALNQNVGIYAEIFKMNLMGAWLAVQMDSKIDVVGLHNKFELCRRFLNSSRAGEGIERCLYLLAPEAQCMSETYRDYVLLRPDDLLLAMEGLCEKKRTPSIFLDRHVTAFLAQRDGKIIEPFVFDLNTGVRHRVVLATVKCIANIQKRYEVRNLPALAKALAAMLPAVYKRYHDRTIREKIQKSIEEFAESGDIQKMAALLENNEVITKDFTAFRKAMQEYEVIEAERNALEIALVDKASFGVQTGKEWAVIFSCVLAAIIIAGTLFMFLSKQGNF